MFGIPWTYIAGFLALVGVIAGGYFAVQSYNSVMKENANLKTQNATLTAEKEQIQKDYQNISSTVDKNAQVEHQVTEKTNTVIREIHDAPVTTSCVESPSIGIALKKLQDPQQ